MNVPSKPNLRFYRSLVAGIAVVLLPALARADSTMVRSEAVNDYSYVYGTHAFDTNAIQDTNNFRAKLLVAGSPYTYGPNYENGSVYDRDFYDPELTNNPSDNDYYSDSPGTGISWIEGHGSTLDYLPTPCSTDANCPAGTYCSRGRPAMNGAYKACISQIRRNFVTSSSLSTHGNQVVYGKDYGGAYFKSWAFGESAQSGAWDNAGMNGGANVVMITHSLGFRPRFLPDDVAYMLAGAHAVLGTMGVNVVTQPNGIAGWINQYSDAAFNASRGTVIGNYLMTHQNSPMLDAWGTGDLVDSLFFSSNPAVATNDGCQFSVAVGPTSANAIWHASAETWAQARNDANDVTGTGWIYYYYSCNYNVTTYGM